MDGQPGALRYQGVLFDHIQKLSLRFYANTRTGEVISRVINDVEQTKDFVITGLMNIWLDMMTVLIVICIMFTLDVKLTLISVILFPLYGISVKYFYGRLRKLTRERSQALAQVQGHLHERVQGCPLSEVLPLKIMNKPILMKKRTFSGQSDPSYELERKNVCSREYHYGFGAAACYRVCGLFCHKRPADGRDDGCVRRLH